MPNMKMLALKINHIKLIFVFKEKSVFIFIQKEFNKSESAHKGQVNN